MAENAIHTNSGSFYFFSHSSLFFDGHGQKTSHNELNNCRRYFSFERKGKSK